MTATWGREVFTPVKFHTFEVGPFSATVVVRKGESGSAAFDRALVAARHAALVDYRAKLAEYFGRARNAEAEARRVARGG